MNMDKVYKKKNKKVAIVALSDARNMVDFSDDSFDFWTINHGCAIYRNNSQIRLCSDLHDWSDAEYESEYYTNILTKIELSFPILVPKINDKIISQQIVYPYDEITKQFGYGIENTLPAVVLYAWYIGYENIYVYGTSKDEYFKYPEMGISYYKAIGFVRGKGCGIWLCNTHEIDNGVSYGLQKLLTKNIKD